MREWPAAPVLTPNGRSRILADGTVMPPLGLGVWQVPDRPACVPSVRAAPEPAPDIEELDALEVSGATRAARECKWW